MGELPEEQDAEEEGGLPVESAAAADPADHGRDGAGDGADEGVGAAHPFHGGVDEYVDGDGGGGEVCCEVADHDGEVDDADCGKDPADAKGHHGIHSAGGKRTVGGAFHAGVEVDFHQLVEGGGSECCCGGSDKGVEEGHPFHRQAFAGEQVAEKGGDEYEEVESHFHQHA